MIKFGLLNGRYLNDWFCFNIQLNNFFTLEISILGYGILINTCVKNSIDDLLGETK